MGSEPGCDTGYRAPEPLMRSVGTQGGGGVSILSRLDSYYLSAPPDFERKGDLSPNVRQCATVGDMSIQKSIRFPDELASRLEGLAVAQDRSFAWVVVRTLEKVVLGDVVSEDGHPRPRKASAEPSAAMKEPATRSAPSRAPVSRLLNTPPPRYGPKRAVKPIPKEGK